MRLERLKRVDDVAGLERRVRAGCDRDLVLAVDADGDECDPCGSVGCDDHVIGLDVVRRGAPSSAARPRSSSPTAPSIHTPVHGSPSRWNDAYGAQRERSRGRDRLVPALSAVMLRERPAGDGLPGPRQRRARHDEVDVDRAEDRDDRRALDPHEPHALASTSARSRPMKRVMNAGASTSSATRALSSGIQPVGHGLRRIAAEVGHGLAARPRPVRLDLDAGRLQRARATGRSRSPAPADRASTRRRSTRSARRTRCRTARPPAGTRASGESGAGAHIASMPSRSSFTRSVTSSPTPTGSLASSTPANAAEHGLRGVRVDPDVRLGCRRDVALVVERAAHDGEPLQELGKPRLLSQRQRDVRERAGRDQQHLAGSLARGLDDEPRGVALGRGA